MKIGIIGAGKVAQSLAPALNKAGHVVSIGSRTPGKSVDGIATVSHIEAVRRSDVVINATRGSDTLALIETLGSKIFEGKVVLDLANANADVPEFQLRYPQSSLGELLQAALPGAAVVKALNTVSAHVMTHAHEVPGSNVFLSGDDLPSKTLIRRLVEDLGWPESAIIDLGALKSARGPESYFVMFGSIFPVLGHVNFNIRVVSASSPENET